MYRPDWCRGIGVGTGVILGGLSLGVTGGMMINTHVRDDGQTVQQHLFNNYTVPILDTIVNFAVKFNF